jgi:ADP-ribose pyrophosphatase YjhB (NUDIX family)
MRELMVGEDPTTGFRFCPRCGGGLEARVRKEGERPRLTCAQCTFVPQPGPRVAAVALFHGDEGIVLVRPAEAREPRPWLIPGGQVELGETAAAAAARSTLEQAGLRISAVGVLDVYSSPEDNVVLIAYAAHVVGGQTRHGGEGLEVAAFPPERLPWDELAHGPTLAALRDYVRRFFPRVRVPR